ncbi:RecB family exonuclease [Patescibacteria group bacterium]
MHTSYSALNSFESCPLRYKFEQIDKLKSPKRVEQVFGTVVHSALKYMFERDPLYPTLDEVIDFYTSKWASASEKIMWRDESKKDAEQKMYFDEGLTILKNFYKKNAPWNFNPVELEGRFILELEDKESKDGKHTLVGFIDRMDNNPETGEYEIIDYKTGKKMPSEESLEDNLQLGLYGLALRTRWPHVAAEKIKTSLYFLKHNDKISATYSDDKLERAKERILTIIHAIEKNIEKGDFPPTPGPLCGWCGHKQICPMFAHEYKVGKEETPTEKEAASATQEFFEIKETEEKNKKRLAELRKTILSFMEDQNLGRVFGDNGYITKTEIPRSKFDLDKAREILEPMDKYNEILTPDEKELEKLIPTLSKEDQEKILETKETKITIMLKQTKK